MRNGGGFDGGMIFTRKKVYYKEMSNGEFEQTLESETTLA